MNTYETNLKPAGRIAALMLAVASGQVFGQTHVHNPRIARAVAPRAVSPGASVAAERYVFGRADLAVGSGPLAVAIGAFQTGGPQSLAVANSGANTVSILLRNPDGTYQAAVDYPTGLSEVQTVITGDFNGDHNPDLALAAYDSDTVAVLLGNGDGTFQPAVNYPAGAKDDGFSLAAADFNRDGHLDLAVLNTSTDTVSILLGNGDGTFQPPVTYGTGDYPAGLAVGDFNGDGIPDLAVRQLPGQYRFDFAGERRRHVYAPSPVRHGPLPGCRGGRRFQRRRQTGSGDGRLLLQYGFSAARQRRRHLPGACGLRHWH
jgi:hypothetical protein